MDIRSAISGINQAGALLVFPMDNRKEPASLWSHFFPRRKMRWEWDESGDEGVADLWRLRCDLSTTRKVIYTKWYRGRATYFSLPVFQAMLRTLNPSGPVASTDSTNGLSPESRRLLAILEGESPVSTKELKRMSGLTGRANERTYERALRTLWSRLLVVAYGEVDEGAFPSLAIGSTRVLFEEPWNEAFDSATEDSEREIARRLDPGKLFYRQYLKLRKEGETPASRGLSRRTLAVKPPPPGIPSVIRFEDL